MRTAWAVGDIVDVGGASSLGRLAQPVAHRVVSLGEEFPGGVIRSSQPVERVVGIDIGSCPNLCRFADFGYEGVAAGRVLGQVVRPRSRREVVRVGIAGDV